VIVTHGTDTLPWSLAYLTYALKRLPCNVALVGSQVPLSIGPRRSDAPANLKGALGVLRHCRPPSVLAICNRGTAAFAGSLVKVDKWGSKPFAGHQVVGLKDGAVAWHLPPVRIGASSKDWCLVLLRTGGTVESETGGGGLLEPGGDLVAAYLENYVGRSFRELVVEEICAHDSVDMNPARWERVAARIVELGRPEGSRAFVDACFASKVGVILLDPWKTESDYRTESAGLDGIVVAGYGGGHVSLDVLSGHAVCGVLTDAIRDGKPVVLASQAPLGETDFYYASSLEPLRRGAIAAVGLMLPHARTKLAYLLGHKDALRAAAQLAGVDERTYLDACFTAGARFRSGTSRRRYAELKCYRPLGTDPFCDLPFDEATVRVRRACFGNLR
jgi:L-asparaginase/Glu-tRNA(Gln) amidotransferase subunit D